MLTISMYRGHSYIDSYRQPVSKSGRKMMGIVQNAASGGARGVLEAAGDRGQHR